MSQAFADALNKLLADNGMSAKELARRVEVDAAQIGRWKKNRGLPRPENLIRVAAVLGVDYEWLFGLAYPEALSQAAEPDPIETAIRSRMAEMREAVRDTPPEFWGTIIKATFDRAIDGARDMAHILAEGQGGTKSRQSTGPKRQSTDLDTPPDTFGEPLTKSFVRVMSLQAASCSS